MKNIIKNWLKRLEESNKESFGSGPLDCCSLGQEKKPVRVVNTVNKNSK